MKDKDLVLTWDRQLALVEGDPVGFPSPGQWVSVRYLTGPQAGMLGGLAMQQILTRYEGIPV